MIEQGNITNKIKQVAYHIYNQKYKYNDKITEVNKNYMFKFFV